MKTPPTYSQAFAELQEIVIEMENSETGIDLLESKVKRAAELLKICREKLYKTEKTVEEVINELKNYPDNT